MLDKLTLSIVPYNNGNFDIIFRHTESGQEITFSGEQELSPEDLEFAAEIAPPCVWTKYVPEPSS